MIHIRVAVGEVANQQAAVAHHLDNLVVNLVACTVVQPVHALDFMLWIEMLVKVDCRLNFSSNGLNNIYALRPYMVLLKMQLKQKSGEQYQLMCLSL